jgi:hypothetical protein
MFGRLGRVIHVGLCLSAVVVSCAFAGSAHAQSVDGVCGQVSPSAAAWPGGLLRTQLSRRKPARLRLDPDQRSKSASQPCRRPLR